jgi:hypothetical protein
MVDMQLIIYSAIGAGVLAAIALIGSNMSTIVSSLSRWNADMIERGRAQRERRARVYGYAAEPVLDERRTSSSGGSAGSWDLVPGQQNHPEPLEPQDSEPFARQLAREELIIMLAVQRKDNGEYLFSANEITKFVGGAAAPVKNTIANVRGRKETPPPARSLTRPMNGW